MKILSWILFSICLIELAACRPTFYVQMSLETSQPASTLGKVAYIQGGDVWIQDLDTNQTTRLTEDGYNREPRWSPDGNWIVYRRQEQLWVQELETRREIPVSDHKVFWFAWSPLDSRLAYFSQEEGLVVWDATSQKITFHLPMSAENVLENFAWAGLSGDLVWNQGSIEEGKYTVSLQAYEPQNQNVVTLYQTADPKGIPNLGDSSPSGRWLTFWSWDTEIAFAQAGMPLCILSRQDGKPTCTEQGMIPSPEYLSWSADDRLIYLALQSTDSVDAFALNLIDPQTWTKKTLAIINDQAPMYPEFSPNSRQIVLSARPIPTAANATSPTADSPHYRKIWMIDVATGGLSQLTLETNARDDLPEWSADGKYLLFARLSQSGASLWLMRSDGSELHQVVPELTPLPGTLGEDSHIQWGLWWDWWRPAVQR